MKKAHGTNGVTHMGIHYVRYRYRAWRLPVGNMMEQRNGWWRVYKNGHFYAPDHEHFWYQTKAEAIAAVKEAMKGTK